MEADSLLGEYERAHGTLVRVLDEAPRGVRPVLLLQLASIALSRRDAEGALTWARRAVDEVDAREAPDALASAEALLALANLIPGAGAGDSLEGARRRLSALDDAALVGHLNGVWSVGSALALAERFAQAQTVLARGLRAGPATPARGSWCCV